VPGPPGEPTLWLAGPPTIAAWALDRAARTAGWKTAWCPTVVEAPEGNPTSTAAPDETEDGVFFDPVEPAMGFPRCRWHPSEDPTRFVAGSSGTASRAVTRAREAGSGAVLVGGREHPTVWTAAEHARRVAPIAAALAREESAGQDVVVLHRPWHEAGARALLSWCETAEAATLLEPRADFGWTTAVWARPTILAATADEWVRWEPWLADRPASQWIGLRRPFGRLRALVTLNAGAVAGGAGRGGDELPPAWRSLANLRGATAFRAG
jgi:hypothetical protein